MKLEHHNSKSQQLTFVVAGASGYVGRALLERITEKFPDARIIALSRTSQKTNHPNIDWKSCDLFSLVSIEKALPIQVDVAYYLVHSMGPTAHLDQGSFSDYDLLLADNFLRALQKKKLQQLIYLGGLLDEKSAQLSLHLQSRLEVEQVFTKVQTSALESYQNPGGLPTTIFRAGLIVGVEGSSFRLLLKLVKRLPIMVCPRWTQTLTTPVELEAVIDALVNSTLDFSTLNKIFDLANCKPLTYLKMLQDTAHKLKVKRFFVPVPFFSPRLSRLWVRLVTGAPGELVYPLIESLAHPMVAHAERSFFPQKSYKSYDEILHGLSTHLKPEKRRFFRFQIQSRTVRSVQRLPLPEGKTAAFVMDQYFLWLPRFLSPLISVRAKQNSLVFCLLKTNIVLIDLFCDPTRSNEDQQLLYIKGGLLVGDSGRGRLEFRSVLGGRYCLAAIHDFRPSLPWFIYKFTQALAHLWVMKAFSRHLSSQDFYQD